MGSKWKPRQLVELKPRNYSAKGMIEAGTGKGGPMRDRRERRSKERTDLSPFGDREALRELQEEEAFYDEQDSDR